MNLLRIALFAACGTLALWSGNVRAVEVPALGDQPVSETPLLPKDREALLVKLRDLKVGQKICREFDECEDVFRAFVGNSVRFIEPVVRGRNVDDEALKKYSSCFNLPLLRNESWIFRDLEDDGSPVTREYKGVSEGPIVVYSLKDFDEFLIGDGLAVIFTGYRLSVPSDRFSPPNVLKLFTRKTCSRIGGQLPAGGDALDYGFFAVGTRKYGYHVSQSGSKATVGFDRVLLGNELLEGPFSYFELSR